MGAPRTHYPAPTATEAHRTSSSCLRQPGGGRGTEAQGPPALPLCPPPPPHGQGLRGQAGLPHCPARPEARDTPACPPAGGSPGRGRPRSRQRPCLAQRPARAWPPGDPTRGEPADPPLWPQGTARPQSEPHPAGPGSAPPPGGARPPVNPALSRPGCCLRWSRAPHPEPESGGWGCPGSGGGVRLRGVRAGGLVGGGAAGLPHLPLGLPASARAG